LNRAPIGERLGKLRFANNSLTIATGDCVRRSEISKKRSSAQPRADRLKESRHDAKERDLIGHTYDR